MTGESRYVILNTTKNEMEVVMNRMKVKSGMAAPLVLAVTVLGASSAASAETPCWAVREWKGAPALFRDGKPTRHRLLPL